MPTWPPDEVTILIIAVVVLGVGLLLMFLHHGVSLTNVKADVGKLFHLHATAVPPVVNVQPTIHVDPEQLAAAVAKALDARAPVTPPPRRLV